MQQQSFGKGSKATAGGQKSLGATIAMTPRKFACEI